MRSILSLCDHSGNWPAPYRDAGYLVHQVDLKAGQDVRLIEWIDAPIHGILAAPPCTAFAGSGAQYWPAKDASGETLAALALVDACLRAVAIYRPAWWALENPVGRLRRYLGPPAYSFDPCDHGDPYTKKTLLWGQFAPPPEGSRRAGACLLAGFVAHEAGRQIRTHQNTPQHDAAGIRARVLRCKSVGGPA